jgi:hypothetical protein
MTIETSNEFLERHLLRNLKEYIDNTKCGCNNGDSLFICWRCLLSQRLEEYRSIQDQESNAQDNRGASPPVDRLVGQVSCNEEK